jgi:hypothetical protein
MGNTTIKLVERVPVNDILFVQCCAPHLEKRREQLSNFSESHTECHWRRDPRSDAGLIVWAYNPSILVCWRRQELCWECTDVFRLSLGTGIARTSVEWTDFLWLLMDASHSIYRNDCFSIRSTSAIDFIKLSPWLALLLSDWVQSKAGFP